MNKYQKYLNKKVFINSKIKKNMFKQRISEYEIPQICDSINYKIQKQQEYQLMKAHSQVNNIIKHIQCTNKQTIKKNLNSQHSAILRIQTLLGIDSIGSPLHNPKQDSILTPSETTKQIPTSSQPIPFISLNQEQVLYYSCQYFVIYNLSSKQYQIINKEVKNYTLKHIRKFNMVETDRKMVVAVYQSYHKDHHSQHTQANQTHKQLNQTHKQPNHHEQYTLLVLLTIKTDYSSRTSRANDRYQWKSIKLNNKCINVEDFTYLAKKSYLYFVITKNPSNNTINTNTNQKITQHIWVYDTVKQNMLMNHQIKSNSVGFYVQRLFIQQLSTIYLIGKNYFRLWTVNFNQRNIKQSNSRNVQRALKNKKIIDISQIQRYIPKQQSVNDYSKLLIILTRKQIYLIKSNQICSIIVPQTCLSTQYSQENIEKQLQNSFKQIYKMKFLLDDEQNYKQKDEIVRKNSFNSKQVQFICMSKTWRSQDNQRGYHFVLATNTNHVYFYSLVDFQLKLNQKYDYSKNNIQSSFKHIVPFLNGDLILILAENKHIYSINQQHSQQDNSLKSLWGNGQMHYGSIFSLASPMIQNIMCSVGDDSSLKLWSLKQNQKTILFQLKLPYQPLGVTMHPCGTMIAVNFQREIKLYSILPKQFYQITSIKTNYAPAQLKYSERGEFLVSNQGSVLLFYEPFSLRSLGYIEPADLKHKITQFHVSSNCEQIIFTTQNNCTYFQSIQIGNNMSIWDHFKPSHIQSQPYTCYYFDFYSFLDKNQQDRKMNNLFVGATKNKYMVIYQNFGQKLIVEFPVKDCFIVSMQVANDLLFVATSKATIRIYNWPILEENLQIQLINSQDKKIRYKPPTFQQYAIWSQNIPISIIHKLRFSNELVIANQTGNMAILSFQQTKYRKVIYEQVSADRKKMQHLINEMFYIKKSQSQKRNKLIQKTENDISKVENQILRQKFSLQRKLMQQQQSVQKTFQIKKTIQQTQKSQHILKQKQQIIQLKKQISIKNQNLENLKKFITQDYQSKKMYENQRNLNLGKQIKQIVQNHKKRILKKSDTHKDQIKSIKQQYYNKIKKVQKDFNKQIQDEYKNIIKKGEKTNNCLKIQRKSLSKVQSPQTMVIGKQIPSMQQQLCNQIQSQLSSLQNQHIYVQSVRVDQLQANNTQLERNIQQLKRKVQNMISQDQVLQKDFQQNLQQYNIKRFQNLNLHSEVLKMQNQLIERRQVLENKEQIVMLAYEEKQKLQNYKQLVKGSLQSLQDKKQNTRQAFINKQIDTNVIFTQLISQIQKMESKKDIIQNLQRSIKIWSNDNQQNQNAINQYVDKLKQIKKFLLLERMSDDKSQIKQNYLYQQSLMTTINFLKKRLFMQSIKQKKNKHLKKSSLNQILKQNKNLLQQCNQLRSQGIQYQNQIKNLGSKLKQAKKMISIQGKLKNQKNSVNQQKGQLQIIREMFQMHLGEFQTKHQDQINDNQQQNDTQRQQNQIQGQYQTQNEQNYEAQHRQQQKAIKSQYNENTLARRFIQTSINKRSSKLNNRLSYVSRDLVSNKNQYSEDHLF